jgi:Asp-tRNA(Asn)/Glu-tRNA(Gln) amidotransferase A subunit family amidase
MFLANLLRWPSGTVPVTTVKADGKQDQYDVNDLPENQRDYIANLVAQGMKGSAGMSLSVSVVTPSFRDKLCLRAMREVEAVVSFQDRV